MVRKAKIDKNKNDKGKSSFGAAMKSFLLEMIFNDSSNLTPRDKFEEGLSKEGLRKKDSIIGILSTSMGLFILVMGWKSDDGSRDMSDRMLIWIVGIALVVIGIVMCISNHKKKKVSKR